MLKETLPLEIKRVGSVLSIGPVAKDSNSSFFTALCNIGSRMIT